MSGTKLCSILMILFILRVWNVCKQDGGCNQDDCSHIPQSFRKRDKQKHTHTETSFQVSLCACVHVLDKSANKLSKNSKKKSKVIQLTARIESTNRWAQLIKTHYLQKPHLAWLRDTSLWPTDKIPSLTIA